MFGKICENGIKWGCCVFGSLALVVVLLVVLLLAARSARRWCILAHWFILPHFFAFSEKIFEFISGLFCERL
jgi:hypothetical protein